MREGRKLVHECQQSYVVVVQLNVLWWWFVMVHIYIFTADVMQLEVCHHRVLFLWVPECSLWGQVSWRMVVVWYRQQ